ERGSDQLDAVVETLLEVDERVVLPNLGADLVASDQTTRVAREQREDAGGLGRQLDGLARAAQLARREIELKRLESQQRAFHQKATVWATKKNPISLPPRFLCPGRFAGRRCPPNHWRAS